MPIAAFHAVANDALRLSPFARTCVADTNMKIDKKGTGTSRYDR